MNGLVLKSKLVLAGKRQYELARVLGWSESKLSRALRDGVDEKTQCEIEKAADEICKA